VYLHSLPLNHISEFTATLRSAAQPLLHVPRTRTVYVWQSRLQCRCTNFMEQFACWHYKHCLINCFQKPPQNIFISLYSLWLLSWLVQPSIASEFSNFMTLHKLVFNLFNFYFFWLDFLTLTVNQLTLPWFLIHLSNKFNQIPSETFQMFTQIRTVTQTFCKTLVGWDNNLN